MVVEDKYIGLALAVTSTLGIGASFVITKKGLNAAAERHGFEGDGFAYLRNPIWWSGIITMVIGEVCNFSAYAFAPAILVTPLGALSVLIGAVLGSYFLGERLGVLGRVGCATCFIGSVVIVLHAPPDKELSNIDELLHFALQPGFLFYCVIVTIFAFVMIYNIAPRYGKKNPMVYLSICSTVGSISIMAIKGFGIAIKLTLGGNNQFTSPSTYVFAIVVVVCILTQMNYFNKALSQFSTNIVNPLYYVTFTTFTLIASFILFRGFNTTDAINTISLLCGFLTIFTGVYLLNLSREDPDGANLGLHGGRDHSALDERGNYFEVDGIPTDGLGAIQTRLSMQARRSGEHLVGSNGATTSGGGGVNSPHMPGHPRRSNSWSLRSPITGRFGSGDQSHLVHSYDVEAHSGLDELAEDSEEEDDDDEERGIGSGSAGSSGKTGKSKVRAVNGGASNGTAGAGGMKGYDSLKR